MRSSFWLLAPLVALASLGCSSAVSSQSPPVATPANDTTLSAETCGQFDLVVEKGKPNARAVKQVVARCDNSYVCTPRVSTNRIELQALSPGRTNLHLEYTDPATGVAQQSDVRIVVAPADSVRAHYATAGCSYIPVQIRR